MFGYIIGGLDEYFRLNVFWNFILMMFFGGCLLNIGGFEVIIKINIIRKEEN